MACSRPRFGYAALIFITLSSGCERQPRAREREAAAAAAKTLARAREEARRAQEPPPPEPPLELVRVPQSGIPCDVDAVFASKCRRCHSIPTRHGAPLVFLTWNDTRQDRLGLPLYTVIGRVVRSNFMPYRIEANPPVEPLTEQEKKTILDWVDAGAPRQDCSPNEPEPKKLGSEPSSRPTGTSKQSVGSKAR